MVNEAVATQSGILFDRLASSYTTVDGQVDQDKNPDAIDIQSAIHDKLKGARGISLWWLIGLWWLIELLPIETGEWKKKWR
jgi:hypothetical protein